MFERMSRAPPARRALGRERGGKERDRGGIRRRREGKRHYPRDLWEWRKKALLFEKGGYLAGKRRHVVRSRKENDGLPCRAGIQVGSKKGDPEKKKG